MTDGTRLPSSLTPAREAHATRPGTPLPTDPLTPARTRHGGATTPGGRPTTLCARCPDGDCGLFGEPLASPRLTSALTLTPAEGASRRAAAARRSR
jgi:hypothetical protein